MMLHGGNGICQIWKTRNLKKTNLTAKLQALPFCPSPLKGGRGKMAELCDRLKQGQRWDMPQTVLIFASNVARRWTLWRLHDVQFRRTGSETHCKVISTVFIRAVQKKEKKRIFS